MPVEKRPAATRRSAPPAEGKASAASKIEFRLRLPDVSLSNEQNSAPRPTPHATPLSPSIDDERRLAPPVPATPSKQRPDPPRDSIAEARAKLIEKRYADSHRQVTGMIEGLRDRRRRIFKRLWTASVLLTALSVVALGVELLQNSNLLSVFGDSAPVAEPSLTGKSRTSGTAPENKPVPAKSDAPRVWSNGLPNESPVVNHAVIENDANERAVIEQIGHNERQGVWLPGTILDNDSESPGRGDRHDDHQSRSP